MNLNNFKGIFSPVPTIVDANGNLDKTGMANLLDHILASDADGMLILGSGGEFGQHAAQIGADAVLVVNPYYALLNGEAIYHHYKTVAENINVPVLLYNFPALTGQDIGIDIITRLAKDVPNIVGLKDTIDNINHTHEVINQVHSFRPDFIIFSGFDEYMLDTLILGGHGGIPATFNFAPQITKGIYNAFINKDYETAFELQRKLAKLMPVYAIESPFWGVIKQAIKLTGVDISTEVIMPVQKLSPDKKQILIDVLTKADISFKK